MSNVYPTLMVPANDTRLPYSPSKWPLGFPHADTASLKFYVVRAAMADVGRALLILEFN